MLRYKSYCISKNREEYKKSASNHNLIYDPRHLKTKHPEEPTLNRTEEFKKQISSTSIPNHSKKYKNLKNNLSSSINGTILSKCIELGAYCYNHSSETQETLNSNVRIPSEFCLMSRSSLDELTTNKQSNELAEENNVVSINDLPIMKKKSGSTFLTSLRSSSQCSEEVTPKESNESVQHFVAQVPGYNIKLECRKIENTTNTGCMSIVITKHKDQPLYLRTKFGKEIGEECLHCNPKAKPKVIPQFQKNDPSIKNNAISSIWKQVAKVKTAQNSEFEMKKSRFLRRLDWANFKMQNYKSTVSSLC